MRTRWLAAEVLLIWWAMLSAANAQHADKRISDTRGDLVHIAVPEWFQDSRASKENGALADAAEATRAKLTAATGLAFMVRRYYIGEYLQGYRATIRTVKPLSRSEAENALLKVGREGGPELRLQPLDAVTDAAEIAALRRGVGVDGHNTRTPAFVGKRVVELFTSHRFDVASTQQLRAETVLWEEYGRRRLGCYYAAENGGDETVPIVFWYDKQPALESVSRNLPKFLEFNATLVDTAVVACPLELSGAYGRFAKSIAFTSTAQPGEPVSDDVLRKVFGPLAGFVKFGITLQEQSKTWPGKSTGTPVDAETREYEKWREEWDVQKKKQAERDKNSCQHYAFGMGDVQMFFACG